MIKGEEFLKFGREHLQKDAHFILEELGRDEELVKATIANAKETSRSPVIGRFFEKNLLLDMSYSAMLALSIGYLAGLMHSEIEKVRKGE